MGYPEVIAEDQQRRVLFVRVANLGGNPIRNTLENPWLSYRERVFPALRYVQLLRSDHGVVRYGERYQSLPLESNQFEVG